jgi:hypothetical protein
LVSFRDRHLQEVAVQVHLAQKGGLVLKRHVPDEEHAPPPREVLAPPFAFAFAILEPAEIKY